ncbi:1-acyl-sn-glycerol-3-phosphate acyltransferase [Eubacteriales bacterium OttesenSCG-928-N13]|nr:1-acyl-sn-glycerol-3-phosphate acyltransferase [Eubacteriales bacterium OttesenSCG-928-N13]
MNPRIYAFVCGLARIIMKVFFPYRVMGLENIPAEGGAILCCNHISLRDPVLMAAAMKRPVRFMAKAELFKYKFTDRFLRAVGAFPVNRGKSDMSSLRTAISCVKEGSVLGIFGQGHRDKSGDSKMESGVALIAMRTGAPVIPALIVGRYKLFRRMEVYIGPRVDLSKYEGKHDGELLRAVATEIESGVRALAPTKAA